MNRSHTDLLTGLKTPPFLPQQHLDLHPGLASVHGVPDTPQVPPGVTH